MGFGRKLKRRSEIEKKRYEEDVERKAKRMSMQAYGVFEQAYQNAMNEADVKTTKSAIVKTAAIAADIIFNNWKTLQKKDTRVENFARLYIDAICKFNKDDKSREEIEKILEEKWNVKINFEE
jgi:hypothetical protein